MEKNKKETPLWKTILNEWESYLATGIFILMTLLLTLQVLGRYLLKMDFTFGEELALALFIFMAYAAVSAAVTHRRSVNVTFVLDILPFIPKKILLIVDDIIFIVFSCVLIYYFHSMIFYLGKSSTSILKIPYRYIYSAIPFFMALASIRSVQDIIRLIHEKPEELGVSKPPIDLSTPEREYLEEKARKEAEKKEV